MASVTEDIFAISNLQCKEGEIKAALITVADHPIFNGHFAGQPVVPGACMLDLVKQVLVNELAKKLLLKNAGNIKFMQMIVPDNDDTLTLKIGYKFTSPITLSVNASISKVETACFKLQAVFALV